MCLVISQRVGVNSSNCDSSKKLLDTKMPTA
jgi:hypothetical protein